MSVLFNMFPCSYNKQFNVSTCNTLLKKIIVDAEKLIETKNKSNEAIREEISKLFWTPQEHDAHNLISTYVDQKSLILVLQYVIYFCRPVARCLLLIESQREVPPDLKEAIASLCYVGSRYIELPALEKLMSQFSIKYGEEFMANAIMCKADCGVSEQITKLLLVRTPPVEERNKLLKEIANDFKKENWEPVSDEDTMPHDNMEIVLSRMQCGA